MELRLILRSLAERRVVCELVLATYRVELTSLLNRMAEGGMADGDLDGVDSLATQIAATASIAELGAVRTDALTLSERAAAAALGGEVAEGAMLLAGLRVIDRILESAKHRSRLREALGPSALN